MDKDLLERKIALVCTGCGGSEFARSGDGIECLACGLPTTEEALRSGNQENISAQTDEMTRKAVEELKKQLENSLKQFGL